MSNQDPSTPSTCPSDDEALLLRFVREREVFCPICKYNLRGLTVPRCPECGRALQLTVGAVEPFLAAWVVAATGTFASSGIGVLLTGFALFKGLDLPGLTEFLAWWSFDASIPLALGAVVFRRRYLRLPVYVQWLLAAFAVTLTIAQIGAFIAFMK